MEIRLAVKWFAVNVISIGVRIRHLTLIYQFNLRIFFFQFTRSRNRITESIRLILSIFIKLLYRIEFMMLHHFQTQKGRIKNRFSVHLSIFPTLSRNIENNANTMLHLEQSGNRHGFLISYSPF